MNSIKTVIIKDYIIKSEYNFEIPDFERKLKEVVERGFRETGEERYFWILKAEYDKLNFIHMTFEHVEGISKEEKAMLIGLLHEFVGLTYDIYISDEL